MKISVAIVDDNTLIRTSLAEQMRYSNEINICFLAKNGIDFLEQMKCLAIEQYPEIVLMDIEMPDMNGIDAVKYAHQIYPDLKFLMLTVFDDDDKIFEAIKSGASGYLLKEEKTSTIIEQVKSMHDTGGVPMSPTIARKALDLLSRSQLPEESPTGHTRPQNLSDRECQVLQLIVEGKDYKAIAAKLFLSTHTIRKHIANIYQKLHVSSKAQVIHMALQSKWFKY